MAAKDSSRKNNMVHPIEAKRKSYLCCVSKIGLFFFNFFPSSELALELKHQILIY